jgi:hypothetical protein
MNRIITVLCAVFIAATSGLSAQSSGAGLNDYIELLKSDFRTQKTALLTDYLKLSEAESKAFWPVYKEYDAELEKLADRRINLIKELANALKDMSQEKSAELMEDALDIESDRVDLWEKYFGKFKDKLMAFRAAQIIMFERELQTIIDLQIYSNMPTIELKKK